MDIKIHMAAELVATSTLLCSSLSLGHFDHTRYAAKIFNCEYLSMIVSDIVCVHLCVFDFKYCE